jgi:7-carboxy-7-deazaguanine synthase
MSYKVKEIFLTLQGEGHHTGRRAVFVRFTGCNLWTGREKDRAKAVCQFCDTDFVGGTRYTLDALVRAVEETWGSGSGRFVVFTGGEPLLQLDSKLLAAVRALGFEVAVETNGTQPAPDPDLWLTVSPKAKAELVQRSGSELKLVYPQEGVDPAAYTALPFAHRYLQPMDGPDLQRNTAAAIAYCLAHPEWKLSLQTHKMVGIR